MTGPQWARVPADVGSMDAMTTSQQPAPITLAPLPDDKNLLTVVDSAGSCCGGGCCSID
ncbi:MAG: hypothetical protein K0Q52_3690 [Microbacterium sp.]|nr:hypothetical protein [Microbacterium sp.]